MLESFKEVLEKEREAEKIIHEAKIRAEKIRENAQQRAETIYNETYLQTVAEAKRKSIEIKEQAMKDAESKSQIFIEHAERMKKKIQEKADKNFGKAVNSILNEILS